MRNEWCRNLLAIAVLAAMLAGASPAAQAQWTWTPQTGRWVNLKHVPKETAELQIEYARSLLIEGNYTKALHETDKFSGFYLDSPLADQNQFLRGEIRMAEGNLVEAAKQFQLVVTKYPNSTLYDSVIKKQYEIGDALYKKGEAKLHKHFRMFRKKPFKNAIQVYSMVIKNQPFTDTAAEAQYKVGLCHHTRKEYTEAAIEYRRVIEDYSTSNWVASACYGLAICYIEGSHGPDYDQAQSQLAVDAIDDFKQRFPKDERLADLEQKRAKMRTNIAEQRLRTAQYYAKRRDFIAARLCYQVVAEQFKETPAAEKAAQWLAKNPVTEARAADAVLKGKPKAL